MPDEQIERVLAEARQAFVVSEAMRPFYTYQRLFQRVAPQMDPEECAATLLVLKLALERFTAAGELAVAVVRVLRDSIRSDGFSRPPPVRVIARRLAVTPVAVEEALAAVIARGYVEEVEPRGIIIRRRRFRFIPPAGDVIAPPPRP